MGLSLVFSVLGWKVCLVQKMPNRDLVLKGLKQMTVYLIGLNGIFDGLCLKSCRSNTFLARRVSAKQAADKMPACKEVLS